jgi:hypothetical protein
MRRIISQLVGANAAQRRSGARWRSGSLATLRSRLPPAVPDDNLMLADRKRVMLSDMSKHLAGVTLLAAALGLMACQPEPVAETKPKRKSFEEPGYQPVSAASSQDAGSQSSYQRTEDQAAAVREQWDRAKAAGSDAERERAATEALRQTQEMADQSAGSGQ